jgi:Tfp pilus assembly protein PilZ
MYTNTIVHYIDSRQRNLDIKSKDKSRLTAAEMAFVRNIAKSTLRDRRINEEILNELKVTSILDKITSYKSDWIQHVN